MTETYIIIESEILNSLYWGNLYATRQLAKIFKCTKDTILRNMKQNEIPRRGNTAKFKKGQVPWNKGLTKETDKRVKSYSGKKNGKYKHGRTAELFGERSALTQQEKIWRNKIYERDNYTCQHCGTKKSGGFNAHHIKSWANYPNLRFKVGNGITLCINCHKKEHCVTR